MLASEPFQAMQRNAQKQLPKSGASANFATPADSQSVPLMRFRQSLGKSTCVVLEKGHETHRNANH
jgi:hypothetical protein